MLVAMNTPPEPMILAQQGTVVIAGLGPQVLVIDRGKAPTEMTVLVLTMMTLIFGGFGVVSMFYALTGALSLRSIVIGAVLLAVGIGAFRAMLAAGETLRRVRLTPLSACPRAAVFDRETQFYLDGAGEIVARLEEVRFERRRHLLGSSLVAVTPSDSRVLKHANLFGGGIGTLDSVLDYAVHAAPHGSP